MKAVRRFALGLFTVAALAACGGGGGGGAPTATAVVPAGTRLTINQQSGAAIAQALANTPIQFNTPVPVLGTTAPTTVTFGANGTFTIQEQGQAAVTGTLSFGSCRFTVAAPSPYTAPHPLAAGNTAVVDPCALALTSQTPATGAATPTRVTVTFGTVVSDSAPITVAVTPQGSVTLVTPNGTAITIPQVITTNVVTGAV
jgi:hypothetical protein